MFERATSSDSNYDNTSNATLMHVVHKNSLNGWGSFNNSTIPFNDTMIYFFAKPDITTDIVIPNRKKSIL